MKTNIISCKTIQAELDTAMEELGLNYPVFYLKSGLHNTPHKLNEALQKQLDAADCERLILAMGYCGNSIAGLRTGKYELIVPKVDDCISLLLGYGQRQAISQEMPTYFMSKGWLEGERNIWTEYTYTINKYGEKTGQEIFDMMFCHYKRLGVLDCGCYDVREIIPETKRIASTLGLAHQVLQTNIGNIKALLTGPWDAAQYIIAPPYSEIQTGDLRLPE